MSPIYFGDQPIDKMYIGQNPDPVTEVEFGEFPPPPTPE